MKKFVALLLAVMLVLFMGACNTAYPAGSSSASSSSTSAAEYTPSYKDRDHIVDMANIYLKYADMYLVSECPDSDVVSAKSVSVGSHDIDTSRDSYSVLTAYGSFYGYDAYGSLVDKYKFDFTLKYYKDGDIDEKFTVKRD